MSKKALTAGNDGIPLAMVWRKSTHSNPNGECVEVGELNGQTGVSGFVHVRDSKHPDGAVLAFTLGEWQAFIAGVHDGEFDH